MLGKVMKYDLKWVCKPLLVFYILGLVFSVATRLLGNIQNSIVFTVITQICSGAAISMMASIVINSLMRCWVRFIRNIYKDESYLTHTLPVKNGTIFLSKVLTGIILMLLSFTIIFACIVIAYGTKAKFEFVKQAITPVATLLEMKAGAVVAVIAIILILEFIFILMCGYLGIILGHKSNNKRIIKSVIYGIVLFIAMSITTVLLLYIAGLFNKNIMNLFNTVEAPNKETMKFLMFGGIVLYTLYNILYGLIGNRQIKKGVNVE